MRQELVDFGKNFVGTKLLFRTGGDQVAKLVFNLFDTVVDINITLDEVVVQNLFLNHQLAIQCSKQLLELFLFIGFRVQ